MHESQYLTAQDYKTSKLPASCVGWFDTLAGLAAVLGVYFWLRQDQSFTHPEFVALLIAANALVMGTIEILRAPWRAQSSTNEPFSEWGKRAGIKMLGFLACVLVIAFFYWLFPEYRRFYYSGYFEVVFELLPWAVPVFIAYFFYVEWRIPQGNDGGFQAGLFVLGKWSEIDTEKFRNYILGWLVKGYFLAIMFGDAVSTLQHYRFNSWDFSLLTFMQAFNLIFYASMGIELIFVAAGYLFSSRLFNTHLRSVETTLYGWVIAVVSYGPFLSLFYVRYLAYRNEMSWSTWLENNEPALWIWGTTILIFMVLHMWCDACFGIRFSNLTNRGIITNGPYRFSKHPAYVIKNIRWWMVSVPFVASDNGIEALKLCLLCFGVNLLYTFRAIAEEKLLSQDPTYIQYALWMDDHGLLRWINKILPFIKYEKRLNYWLKNGSLKVGKPEAFS